MKSEKTIFSPKKGDLPTVPEFETIHLRRN